MLINSEAIIARKNLSSRRSEGDGREGRAGAIACTSKVTRSARFVYQSLQQGTYLRELGVEKLDKLESCSVGTERVAVHVFRK